MFEWSNAVGFNNFDSPFLKKKKKVKENLNSSAVQDWHVCVTVLGPRAAVRFRPGSSSSQFAPTSPAHCSEPPLSLGLVPKPPHLQRIIPPPSLSSMTSREVSSSSKAKPDSNSLNTTSYFIPHMCCFLICLLKWIEIKRVRCCWQSCVLRWTWSSRWVAPAAAALLTRPARPGAMTAAAMKNARRRVPSATHPPTATR